MTCTTRDRFNCSSACRSDAYSRNSTARSIYPLQNSSRVTHAEKHLHRCPSLDESDPCTVNKNRKANQPKCPHGLAQAHKRPPLDDEKPRYFVRSLPVLNSQPAIAAAARDEGRIHWKLIARCPVSCSQ